MIETFEDMDGRPASAHASFQSWRSKHPKGFVVNVRSASNLMLHATMCQHFGNTKWRCPQDDPGSLTESRKLCSDDLHELLDFAISRYSLNPVRCKTCRPRLAGGANTRSHGASLDGSAHYIAYHSASRMGRQYRTRGAEFGFLSWKPEVQLKKCIGKSVWVIASDGLRPLRYFLAGVYTPNRIKAAGDGWEVWGRGTRCEPHIEVTGLRWFELLRKEQNNFSFGFNRIRSPEVIAALAEYMKGFPTETILPDEVRGHWEGMGVRVMVNRYERDSAARIACLKEFGTACFICKTDLSEIYGDIAAGLIHVHHLTSISAIGREYKVNPTKDLIPICPNCHAVAHRREPPLSPEEMRKLLKRNDRIGGQ